MAATTTSLVVASGPVLAVLYLAAWLALQGLGRYDIKVRIRIYGLSIRFTARKRRRR